MRYRKIDSRLWLSKTFRSLSEDARILYQYLLTSPHNNVLCCFSLPVLYAAHDLQWLPERLREPFQELLDKRNSERLPMISRDEAGITFVHGQLIKEGLVNGNAVKAAIKVLDTLPSHNPIYKFVLDEVIYLSKQTDKPFHEPLAKLLRERLREPFQEPLVKPLQEPIADPRAHVQEQEQEQEQELSSKLQDEEENENDLPFDLPKENKNLEISKLLFSLMLKNNPKAKKPNYQTWSKEIDLAHRVDKRSYDDLEKIIRWSQKDNFWKTNILNTKKLRDQFDQLWIKMKNGNGKGKTSLEDSNKRAVDEFLEEPDGITG